MVSRSGESTPWVRGVSQVRVTFLATSAEMLTQKLLCNVLRSEATVQTATRRRMARSWVLLHTR